MAPIHKNLMRKWKTTSNSIRTWCLYVSWQIFHLCCLSHTLFSSSLILLLVLSFQFFSHVHFEQHKLFTCTKYFQSKLNKYKVFSVYSCCRAMATTAFHINCIISIEFRLLELSTYIRKGNTTTKTTAGNLCTNKNKQQQKNWLKICKTSSIQTFLYTHIPLLNF